MNLTNCGKTTLFRGTMFRFAGAFPFEALVDFMLVCYPDSESGFAMMCVSGYCAGMLECVLPPQACSGESRGIATKWLAENWSQWVYAGATAEQVEVLEPGTPGEEAGSI